ncbi:hypothetical protein M3P05_04315 [Sansalvadorimonas sp. 2012CJ34-2]|uniref:HEAT repeat domain-containing protein n=1 Tax=Parendozoicomonas callyspongiae TaxID=2942213 RepID=A0ABT0PEG0_9GAMM|nr:hypothetical protein [Sansalvadorimonas sp. 2012CJ34-2]MCL6269167.1 hypothetical protein [Sansalvadorimonas sp. 2012CJ34-2]
MDNYGYSEEQAQKFSLVLDSILHIDRHKDALPKIKKMGHDFCRLLLDQAAGTSPRKTIRLYALGQALGKCTDKASLSMISHYIVGDSEDRSLKRELITALAENKSSTARAALSDVINQLFLDWLESHDDSFPEDDAMYNPLQETLWTLAYTKPDKLIPSVKRLAKDALTEKVDFPESILEPVITILGNTQSKGALKLLKEFAISPFSNIYPGTLAEALMHKEQAELAQTLAKTFRIQCEAEPEKSMCEHQRWKVEWVESQAEIVTAETAPESETDTMMP